MKKTLILMTALTFLLTATAALQAATLKCTVTEVEGTVVTMECGKKAATLTPGAAVKVKTAKAKTAAIEGC